jgi:hypothetical protein
LFWNAHGTGDAEYVLKRLPDPKRAGSYTLEESFQYRDHRRGTFTVPKPGTVFVTDLASIPGPASWLVPVDGTHTPAALLHDALVRKPDEPVVHDGPDVTRETADLMFREAMQHLEVPLLRRWMMWSAVSMATLFTPGDGRRHWYWRVLIPILVAALLGIGFLSVLDLVDLPGLRLPWMGDRTWWRELLGGAVAAIVAAVVAPLPWGRRWRVGLVAALALIPLAFPLVVAGAAYAVYQVVEIVAYKVLQAVQPPSAPPAVQPKPLKRLG